MIGTSINIEKSRLQKLKTASEKIRISERELLSILILKSRRLFGNNAVIGRTVEYQRNSGPEKFVIYHIDISESDYEFATGRRYLFKISVSLLIRMAIDFFLSEIIYEWTSNRMKEKRNRKKYTTNSHYKSFCIIHYVKDSTEIWKIPWPVEEKDDKK